MEVRVSMSEGEFVQLCEGGGAEHVGFLAVVRA